MVDEARGAADILSEEGIDCELINPRTVQPLDIDLIVESVSKTGNLVIVHEAVRFGGIGAEIAAQIQEEAFDYLDAPIGRVAAPFSPIPFSPVLEKQYVPDAERIAAGVRNLS
jgi:pyruvate dehydrogenase E1 component beta subunit